MDRLEKLRKKLEKEKNRQRSSFDLQTKYEAIMIVESGVSQKRVYESMGVKKSTFNTWMRKKDAILKQFNSGQETKEKEGKGWLLSRTLTSHVSMGVWGDKPRHGGQDQWS